MTAATVRVVDLEPINPPVRTLHLVPQPLPTWQQLAFALDPAHAPQPDAPPSLDPALAGMPDVDTWVRQLVVGLLEALAGTRPPQQLVRWLEPTVFLAVTARCKAAPARPGPIRATVSSVHSQCPTEGIVEATAVVRLGNRFRAVALRLRADEGRWRCAAVQVL
jgi:hypothetical protein